MPNVIPTGVLMNRYFHATRLILHMGQTSSLAPGKINPDVASGENLLQETQTTSALHDDHQDISHQRCCQRESAYDSKHQRRTTNRVLVRKQRALNRPTLWWSAKAIGL
ncbi:hypothetical protein RvY_17675 [Ramazzottius varieornatus]|uniref:Uncharacterized protein n=1 Tax=Ramazzottius varieornatus TaxID=947166 RepID=A0A1D1W2Z9_RAMVA|nr:hypothetical protein RvY_17675 [Ramazzottius varieornatus]